MEHKLHSHPQYMLQMERAHISYGNRRWETLIPSDQELVTHVYNYKYALDSSCRGVAGIRSFGTVKCLHAHVAHYLAQLSEWEEEEQQRQQQQGENLVMMTRECQRDDLNLVGMWTMENLMTLLQRGEKP